MTEAFLHYIWKHQYFDKTNLQTTDGEYLIIMSQGFHNTDAGPDFKESKISIDGIEWSGHVEIHINASDWNKHKHQLDAAYNNTILHVVLSDDEQVFRSDGTKIPTLALKDKIYLTLIQQYDQLLNKEQPIPCDSQLSNISDLTKISMIDKALAQRLERKSGRVLEFLIKNNNDWEETTYQLLAENFGFKINSGPFLSLAQTLPYKILKKHADQALQVESLLFGQAGFLEQRLDDDYHQKLTAEYKFLKSKYDLKTSVNLHQWKFLRLRPANFPTVRIAQFAALMCNRGSLFSLFIGERPKTIIEKLRIDVSAYWMRHYQFGASTEQTLKGIGKNSAILVCINTIAPLLAAYGRYVDDQKFMDRALELLQYLPAEKNKITKLMQSSNFKLENAFDTQGAIELYNNFCTEKMCLTCNIGAQLLKPA